MTATQQNILSLAVSEIHRIRQGLMDGSIATHEAADKLDELEKLLRGWVAP